VTSGTAGAGSSLPGFQRVRRGPSGGAVYRGTFPSSKGPAHVRLGYVYLPPRFSSALRYPVVYLLHGLPGAPSEYIDALRLASVADGLITSKQVRPFIAIVPAAGSWRRYRGEWAGAWERYLVSDVVPWVDAHLPTEASRSGRVLAGLSAGGYGAANIGIRSPRLFGQVESWSGYFHPLPDGSFVHASPARLAANDPFLLVVRKARQLRTLGTRFCLGSGPSHTRWFKQQETVDFAHELQRLGLPHTLMLLPVTKGQYRLQLAAGLKWALHEPRRPPARRA